MTVSSSIPSSPRKTSAETPRRARTAASSGASRASATPTARAFGAAGFVSGPRMLNTVRMPNSRRGPAACRIAGWNSGAKQNVMPTSSATSAICGAGRSSATPSSSRTSAEPHAEDAERLPCLTTRAPAPAATTADIVEMLTLWDPSPPVPTMSSVGPGTDSGTACAYMASTRPSISSAVSPLARSATIRPASRAGPAAPDITWSIAQAVSAADRSLRLSSAFSSSGQLRPCGSSAVTGTLLEEEG